MLTATRRVAFAIAIIIGQAVAAVSATDLAQITGIYRSERVAPDGHESGGYVQIVSNGESYLVSWVLSPPAGAVFEWDPNLIGVGVIRGDMLAVSYFSEQTAGVVLYRIEKDGRLSGRWTTAGGDGRLGTETLTKVSVATVRGAR